MAYDEKVLSDLSGAPCTLTELSRKMGYKGITKKLRSSITRLVEKGSVKQIIDGGTIKYKSEDVLL